MLPRLDKATRSGAWFGALDSSGVTMQVEPVERAALPQWIAQRLRSRASACAAGEEGQRTLQFFADRVEGNLLAAHQEIQKLGAAVSRRASSASSRSRARCSTWRATTCSSCPRRCWPARPRACSACSTACRPRARPRCWCTTRWPRTSARSSACKDAMAAGRPLPMALREQRVWGVKERLFERVLPRLTPHDAGQPAAVGAPGRRHRQGPEGAGLAHRRLAGAAPAGDGAVPGVRAAPAAPRQSAPP